MQTTCLAIVAGSGDLPMKIVEYCKKHHLDFRIIHFDVYQNARYVSTAISFTL